MNCCTNCFADPGLKKRIEALSTVTGNCNFCGSTELIVISCSGLSNTFEQLFEMYTSNPNAQRSLGISAPVLIHEHLIKYWPRLFDLELLAPNMIQQLVNQIGRGWDLYTDERFENPVEFSILIDTAGVAGHDLQLQWDTFSNEIRSVNRFFIDKRIDTDELEVIFANLVINYPAGTEFFRARISDNLLPTNEMGKPPIRFTTPGRANPIGIPYLYVSEGKETTLYETRVALHEGITIAKLNVVSLKNITEYGPFELRDRGFAMNEFVLVRPYLLRLEHELSKPVCKQDVHLDYLPTQYLCEFIKSKGFEGVEYRSAMNAKGYNLAIFNDRKLECVESVFDRVNDLTYKLESAAI